MKTIEYKSENYNITQAGDLLVALETELGFALHSNEDKLNKICGYLNTSDQGDVEINFYGDEEAALYPQIENCGLTIEELIIKCDNVIIPLGFIRVIPGSGDDINGMIDYLNGFDQWQQNTK